MGLGHRVVGERADDVLAAKDGVVLVIVDSLDGPTYDGLTSEGRRHPEDGEVRQVLTELQLAALAGAFAAVTTTTGTAIAAFSRDGTS